MEETFYQAWLHALKTEILKFTAPRHQLHAERLSDMLKCIFPELQTSVRSITEQVKQAIKRSRVESETCIASRSSAAELFTVEELLNALKIPEVIHARLQATSSSSSQPRCSVQMTPLLYSTWKKECSADRPTRTLSPSSSAQVIACPLLQPLCSEVWRKSSGWLGQWKVRWLKVSLPKGLEIFKKPSEPALYQLELSEIRSACFAPSEFESRKKFCFLIHTESSTPWIFACESKEQVEIWIQRISTFCIFDRVVHSCRRAAVPTDQLTFTSLAAIKRHVQNGARLDERIEHMNTECCLLELCLHLESNDEIERIIQTILTSATDPCLLSSVFLNRKRRESNDGNADEVPFSIIGSPICVIRHLSRLKLPLDVHSTDGRCWSYLMDLCARADTEGIRELISILARDLSNEALKRYVQARNIDGDSALSISLKHTDNVKGCLLLLPYSDVNACDGCGDTVLHTALRSSDAFESFVHSLILDFKADLTAVDQSGNTPLHLALLQQRYGIAHQIVLQLKQRLKIWQNTAAAAAAETTTSTFRTGRSSLLASPRRDGVGMVSKYAVPLWDLRERQTHHTVMTLALQQEQEALCCELLSLGASADANGVSWRYISTASTAHVEEGSRYRARSNGDGDGDGDESQQSQDGPLHIAIKCGLSRVVDKLIDCGALVTRCDRNGESPLSLAVRHGLYHTAYRIVCSLPDRQEQTPMHSRLEEKEQQNDHDDQHVGVITVENALQALTEGQLELFALLLDRRNTSVQPNGALLHTLVHYRRLGHAEQQHSSAALVMRQMALDSMFILAIRSPALDIDVNAADTPHGAEQYRMLQPDGSFVPQAAAVPNAEGATALHLLGQAAMDTALGLLDALLEHPELDTLRTDSDGETAVISCIRSGWELGLKTILTKSDTAANGKMTKTKTKTKTSGAQDRVNRDGDSPLHIAVALSLTGGAVAVQKRIDVVVLLLRSNAYSTAWDAQGRCPLHVCVLLENNENADVVNQLIRLYAAHHGDVNVRSAQDGETALMLAVAYGHRTSVKALLDAGAELRLQRCGSSRSTAAHLLLAILRSDPTAVCASIADTVLDHLARLPEATLECVRDHSGQSVQDVVLELTELQPHLTRMSPRCRSHSLRMVTEYMEHRGPHRQKRNSLPTTTTSLSETESVSVECLVRRASLPVRSPKPNPQATNGTAVASTISFDDEMDESKDFTASPPSVLRDQASKGLSGATAASSATPSPSPPRALPFVSALIPERLQMDRSEIENFVANAQRAEERKALRAVAAEAQEIATEWLKKKSGKHKVRTNAFLLLQQNGMDDAKLLTEPEAIEVAAKNFIEDYVQEAVAEAQHDIDRERRAVVHELCGVMRAESKEYGCCTSSSSPSSSITDERRRHDDAEIVVQSLRDVRASDGTEDIRLTFA